MQKPLFATVLTLLALLAAPLYAADPAPLGSGNFLPTPEHPVGFRGDSTGLFPGATPPVEWSRRVKGLTTELRYQAGKPAGQPAKDARQLEYFTIKDWLVAGPFSVDDAVKDFDKDLLNGEATVEPAQDAKAGDATWKFLRVGIENQSRHEYNEGTVGHLNVDFLYTFGTITPKADAGSKVIKLEGDFVNKVAYAHTYIYAPTAGKVILNIPCVGSAGRFWLNGKATKLDPKAWDPLYPVELAQGWNRLLIKISTANGVGQDYTKRWLSNWRFAAYIQPVTPVSYETKNVAWMTRMTGRSVSQPIVVGDKIFLGSGNTDLLCIDKTTGKLLWIRASSPYDAMTAEQKQAAPEIKEKIEPMLGQFEQLTGEALTAINASVSPQGMSSDAADGLDKKLRQRSDLERNIHKAFLAIDKAKYPNLTENEVSATNPTPISDGTYVYSLCGGGAGKAALLMSCFDLAGKRIWTFHAPLTVIEHGTHLSPALADGKLIFGSGKTLLCLDAKTGKEIWRNEKADWDANFASSSPTITSVGNQKIIIGPRLLYRLNDGSEICKHGADPAGSLTPVVSNGVLIMPYHNAGWDKAANFLAVKLPATTDKVAKLETLINLDGTEANMPLRGPGCMLASPLVVNGLVYSVDVTAGLAVVDLAARKCLYRQWLDGYDRYNRMVYGVAASPTLGGKNIYIIDDAGYTHILTPGPTLQETHHNVIENIHNSGGGGNPCRQESFYTAPFFQGSSMYLRGEEYLYCITEKSGK